MTNTGRFAPSPTGDFHLGNLRTAILAWAWARVSGRRFVLRIEDIDRARAGSADRQIADLEAIGIDWDGDPLVQTTRADAHEAALEELAARGLLFECYCSRRDIREAASAPHVPPGHYPGTCLSLSEEERRARREALAALGRAPALRLAAPCPTWTVTDELYGDYTGPVDHFAVPTGFPPTTWRPWWTTPSRASIRLCEAATCSPRRRLRHSWPTCWVPPCRRTHTFPSRSPARVLAWPSVTGR